MHNVSAFACTSTYKYTLVYIAWIFISISNLEQILHIFNDEYIASNIQLVKNLFKAYLLLVETVKFTIICKDAVQNIYSVHSASCSKSGWHYPTD